MHTHREKTCTRPVTHGPHTWRDTGAGRGTYRCPGAVGRPWPGPTVVLRADAFDAAALRALGWGSLTEAARSMGLNHSTLRRAVAGQIVPGERLIAACIAGTGRSFDALFRVV